MGDVILGPTRDFGRVIYGFYTDYLQTHRVRGGWGGRGVTGNPKP